MIKKLFLALFATVGFGFGLSANASVSVVPPGGLTSVTLTSANALTDLGLMVSPLGSASILTGSMFPVATFPITGGFNDSAGNPLISHNGAGLLLDSGTTTVALENFFIDFAASLVYGDVSVNGSFFGPLAIFSIDPSLHLLLTDVSATALNGVYGTSLPVGLEIGVASVELQPVPLPPALGLFVAALAGLSALRRRKTTA